MKSIWKIKDSSAEKVAELVKEASINEVFARLLINRGICSVEEMESFLQPTLKKMHKPELLAEMEKAAKRIAEAIRQEQKIFVYGDYDVDGVTGTSLLYRCLKLLKADVNYYLPHRTKEGYGLNVAAIKYIIEQQTQVLVTVDCGIRGFQPIAYAAERGVDVIITDHHEIEDSEHLPPAYAIVNPKDSRGNYPFAGISGVGVAFKLAWALCQEFSPEKEGKVLPELRQFLLDSMAFVAIGTIADMVPLMDENRVMVRYGLMALEKSSNPGLKALKEVTRISRQKSITPQHVSFRIAPLINATGRMAHPRVSAELLTSESEREASIIASKIDTENKRRRRIQQRIYQDALKQIKKNRYTEEKLLVLADERWHTGVIGIVASRVLEIYYRPVCIISVDQFTQVGKASARSIPGFNLFEALKECKEHLIDFGGHAMAAGFQIEKGQIAHLRQKLNRLAGEMLDAEQLNPAIEIDSVLHFSDIGWDLVHWMEKLSPFGQGNPSPVFLSENVEVITNPLPERRGNRGDHLIFYARQGKRIIKAVAFGQGEQRDALLRKGRCNLVYSVIRNQWNGQENIELEIKDMEI